MIMMIELLSRLARGSAQIDSVFEARLAGLARLAQPNGRRPSPFRFALGRPRSRSLIGAF